ncbi:hypothetical protein SKAU_G00207590 [Synaphobranchus kaupii]|uniref:Uncharacterized protein n=1 Tax=Synaphobranchus kaupii TaxID=118154 RepID=A0A9Q1ITQ3_SYNKA|nr:hypothetical protein SKAU_G00207590 [Synaphobranchus kaupii]
MGLEGSLSGAQASKKKTPWTIPHSQPQVLKQNSQAPEPNPADAVPQDETLQDETAVPAGPSVPNPETAAPHTPTPNPDQTLENPSSAGSVDSPKTPTPKKRRRDKAIDLLHKESQRDKARFRRMEAQTDRLLIILDKMAEKM